MKKLNPSILIVAILITSFSVLLASCKPRQNQRTSADLLSFTQCSQLESRLKENLRQETKANLLYYNQIMYREPMDGAADGAPGGMLAGTQEGVDYSGTNNQEAGVDEADFVKTDGSNLYLLNNNALYILPAIPAGHIDNGTHLSIEGTPAELLIGKDTATGKAVRAVVFSTVFTGDIKTDNPLYAAGAGGAEDSVEPGFRSSVLTKLTLVDLSGASPEVRRELYFEGSYQTARLIENSLHVVLYAWIAVADLVYWPELPDSYYRAPTEALRKLLWEQAVQKAIERNELVINALTLDELLPRSYEKTGDTITLHRTEADCSKYRIADDGVSRGFTTIVSLDVQKDNSAPDDQHIVSNCASVYASSDALLIAEPANGFWWYWANTDFEEATNIHKFTLSPESCAYSGSGRIDGTTISQFSLSEYQGAVRIAATTNAWGGTWRAEPVEPENHIYILTDADNGSLTTAGHVGGVAKGERIWSSRFIGARCYLVTFRTIDPLWTIDLSDIANPRVLGEVDVPGVSTYIHPLADDRLLTIGLGGTENGFDGTIQVSLFDVSDFANPELLDQLSLTAGDSGSTAWGSSQALSEHKAFQYWEPQQMLAVPLSSWQYTAFTDGSGTCTYTSNLVLLKVNKDSGFTPHGLVDHSDYFTTGGSSWYWSNPDIKRSIFIDEFLYAISDRAVTAHRLDTLAPTGSVQLPGTQYESWGYSDMVRD